MTCRKVSYYFDFKFGNFIFSLGHPMKPLRINMVYELIKSYGLENWMNIKKGKNISYEEMGNFHQERHISRLNNGKVNKEKFNIESIFPINNGDDCPIFLGLLLF